MIHYCTRCLLPATKPDLWVNADGVCSACLNFDARAAVDWKDRKRQLLEQLELFKTPSGYDCIVPVSGGKDSHYQVIKMLEFGIRPLCVTATTDDLSDLGRKNIENLKHLGVDYFEVSTNPVVRRRINRIALERVGDISWPEHVTIFTIPVRIAVQMGVPLICWGEDPQNEYGGPKGTGDFQYLDNRWLQEFGGLLGLRVSDLLEEGFAEKDLIQYRYPPAEDLEKLGMRSFFLGYYFPWDGRENASVAKNHGFTWNDEIVEGSSVAYENLDNHQTGIHDFFKFLKFGFSRATDITSMWVRRGYMSRDDALRIVKARDGKFPWTYLGKSITDILAPLGMSVNEFIGVCEKFTNWDLFKNKEVTHLEKVNSDNAG